MRRTIDETLAAGVRWTSRPYADVETVRRRGTFLHRRRWTLRVALVVMMGVPGYLGVTGGLISFNRPDPVKPAGRPNVLLDTCVNEEDCSETPQSTPSESPPDPSEPGYVVPGPESDTGRDEHEPVPQPRRRAGRSTTEDGSSPRHRPAPELGSRGR